MVREVTLWVEMKRHGRYRCCANKRLGPLAAVYSICTILLQLAVLVASTGNWPS